MTHSMCPRLARQMKAYLPSVQGQGTWQACWRPGLSLHPSHSPSNGTLHDDKVSYFCTANGTGRTAFLILFNFNRFS